MTDAIEFATRCPVCGTNHELTTAVREFAVPKDGDFTMCFRCGVMSVFDKKAEGGLRRPSKREAHMIERDDTIRAARREWRKLHQ